MARSKADKPKRPPFHEEFASKIIERLQQGTAPWQVPWTPGKASLVPHNPASGTVYRGMNRVHLALSGYDDPRWMTLKQANDQGKPHVEKVNIFQVDGHGLPASEYLL